jgi:hypothetical protein
MDGYQQPACYLPQPDRKILPYCTVKAEVSSFEILQTPAQNNFIMSFDPCKQE